MASIQVTPTSGHRDPSALSNLPEILSCLSALQSEEVELSNSLTELLNAGAPITTSLHRLHSLTLHLHELRLDASLLLNKVSQTAETAKRVGGQVRSLDDEMARVREAGERVGQVMELKVCLASLHSSIENQDWESAARYCARAMSQSMEVISGRFAETAVPTSESHLPPSQTLQLAREKLLLIFRQNFEEASRSRDFTTTSRFFKLFPEIGWEAEGLEAYASFVVDLVRVRAPPTTKASSPLYYTTALTALFESIAMIVDQHQPVVEKYYGPGKMRSVVERLVQECDRVVRGIVNAWEEERCMKRKLLDVTNNPPIPMFSPSNRRPPSSTGIEDVVLDPRDIDKVLSELAGMIGRWRLFRKFITESPKEDHPDTVQAMDASPRARPLIEENVSLNTSETHRIFESLTTQYYTTLEVWYIRTSIDKAHRLSNPDTSQSPAITTTPDDVFYLLKTVISRLLSTGSLSGVESTFEQLREVMEQEYIAIIKKKLDDVYRATGSSGSHVKIERMEKELRVAFIILLNDLDISSSHLERLMRDLSGAQAITQNFNDEEQTSVKSYMTAFTGVGAKLRSTLRVGVEQLFNQLMRPKLRTLIPDIYKDVLYVVDDDAYHAAEYQDVVRKRFIKSWENLVNVYKETLTNNNFLIFFGLALDVVLRPWEKLLMGLKFTELGAIRFDRDLRSVTTFLSSQTAFGDAREKFVRLQQVSTILNLDREEDVDEFYNSSGILWKLTATEARGVARLKL